MASTTTRKRMIRTVQVITATSLLIVGCGTEKDRAGGDLHEEKAQAKIEEIVGQHMVSEALLTAHFVAAAERAGMSSDSINAILRNVAEQSAIDEFWITDSLGHAYLTSTGVNFTFSPDPTVQPQASAFWPLLDGKELVVIQKAEVREIDSTTFKYVGVAGVDKPRIVQIGVSAEDIVDPK
ncbi:MAG: hypothetical protein AB7H80_02640 [Candidatus Kapaibacterium sp.]